MLMPQYDTVHLRHLLIFNSITDMEEIARFICHFVMKAFIYFTDL